jgi:hypothetical protein
MKITNTRLAIGVPLSFPWVPSSFFHSFIQMEKPDYTYLYEDSTGPIHELRNNLVSKALEVGATKLLMCDIDQVYHPLTVTKLMAHNLPVVGALVHRRYPPFDSLMMKIVDIDKDTKAYASIDDWDDGELIEVDATGTGCIMYDMSVFRKIPKPWFKSEYGPGGIPIGEDFGFCLALKNAGYKIFVDTSIPAGHLTTMIVNTATNKLYRAMKTPQQKDAADIALGVDGKKIA